MGVDAAGELDVWIEACESSVLATLVTSMGARCEDEHEIVLTLEVHFNAHSAALWIRERKNDLDWDLEKASPRLKHRGTKALSRGLERTAYLIGHLMQLCGENEALEVVWDEAGEASKGHIINVLLCHVKDFDHRLQDSGWPFKAVVNKQSDQVAF